MLLLGVVMTHWDLLIIKFIVAIIAYSSVCEILFAGMIAWLWCMAYVIFHYVWYIHLHEFESDHVTIVSC